MKLKPHIRTVILLIAMLAATGSAKGQTKTNSDSLTHFDVRYIGWVGEFPNPLKKQKRGFFRQVGEFFFGKKERALSTPVSVVASNPNKYWVLDQKMGAIVMVEDGEGERVKLKLDDEQPMTSLVGMCEIPQKGLLFTDSRSNNVYFLKFGSKRLSFFGDTNQWFQPTGIAYSEVTRQVWLIETKVHRISILNEEGRVVKVIGKRGFGEGEFNFPTHIWVDKNGWAYVVDAMNFRIQVFNEQGEFVTMFGKTGDEAGSFARSKGIATDSHGNIFVVDALFHNVQIFNLQGQLLYFFGNQGREQEQFWLPNGIFISDDDFIYIADTYNARIQFFKLNYHE